MHDSALWQAVLGEIELTVSRGSFVTWFKNTQLLKNKDGSITIGVPNIFIKQQLERKYNTLIYEMLTKNGLSPEKIDYKIHTLAPRPPDEDTVVLENPHAVTSPQKQVNKPVATPLTHTYRQGLNEKYTFDNFIVGSGNELAYAACQAIAQNPGTKYNPLFIYGGVGIGKTHLIQAVGNAVIANKVGSRVVYVSTEQFVQEFLDAIRYKKNTDFAGYYRSADVLIIDDVQFIAGKEKTQDEFFHTFNALHQANKQIIISSDRPPKDIPTLTDRLRSRFEWGMAIDMQTPDFETRCVIVQMKAQNHNVTLPQPVVEYLATHIQTNIRELEGALNQLLAYCEMRGVVADLSVVTTVFGNTKGKSKHVSARTIIEKTARYFQVQLEDVMSPKRDKDIVFPRQIAMYLLRNELHMSFPKIAHELGRKDHTTAIHSIEKIEKEINSDEQIRQHINDIKERLYA